MQGSLDASTSLLPAQESRDATHDAMNAPARPNAASEIAVTDSFLKRLCGLAGNKAGLKRDPEEVRRIIHEVSKGSDFYRNEQKRDAATTVKVEAMLASLAAKVEALHGDLSGDEAEVDRRIAVLEATKGKQIHEVSSSTSLGTPLFA
jgi:hypothetical protein